MLSPQLRNKVHNLWTLFWSAGMTNPLVAIEQITYLLFIRQLEHLDRARVANGKPSIFYSTRVSPEREQEIREALARSSHGGGPGVADAFGVDYAVCRWSYIKQSPSFDLLNNTVFPWLRGLEKWLAAQPANGDDMLRQVTGRLDDAYFVLDPNKTETLQRAVTLIDDLFKQLDARSANSDIMGDIFEHLLGQIDSAGKNGQFRTPRQIIRFMVELIDPPVGSTILDPACGTGGFLVNTLLHWKKKQTASDVLKLEWDGTPQRAFGVLPENVNLNACFHGYDNDRTMVRIAWMNLILHDLEFPHIEQRDTLSKKMDEATDKEARYDFILANPPFTGSVDEGDLSKSRLRIPAGKGEKPITTKSELLFVWLILDLLRTGGRAAVVVPDGVLFGSTNAHRELRRQLLFENTLEGVISLPAGVFLPYAGVKTSILVFQKVAEPIKVGDEPRTREVWFYEVEDEAFSLDQKRKERFEGPNDLYDATEKFKAWCHWLTTTAPRGFPEQREVLRHRAAGSVYFQPFFYKERWRVIDEDFVRIFPEHSSQQGQVLSLGEIFGGATAVAAMEKAVCDDTGIRLYQHLGVHLIRLLRQQGESLTPDELRAKAPEICRRGLRDLSNQLARLVREEKLLDREYDQFGWNCLQRELERLKENLGDSRVTGLLEEASRVRAPEPPDLESLVPEFREILLQFARLDGYDVWLRGLEGRQRDGKPTKEPNGYMKDTPRQLSWIVPVRAWVKSDTWGKDPDSGREIRKSTHDGNVPRADYLTFLRDRRNAFEADGTVKAKLVEELLDPACIEATELSLSASRHKPFTFDAGTHRPAADIIRELDATHVQVREKLGRLLAVVKGRE